MLERRPFDRDVATGHRREADERTRLDVVGADRILRTVQRLHAFDFEDVGPDTLDSRTHQVQQMTEILDVGLRRRIANSGVAFGADCGHDRVLGTRHRRLVQKHVRPEEPLGGEGEAAIQSHLCTQCLEGQKVGVHPAPPDHVASGRGELHVAKSG